MLDDEYASDEQRRAAPRIGPAHGLTVGCGGNGPSAASLLASGPLALATRLARIYEAGSTVPMTPQI